MADLRCFFEGAEHRLVRTSLGNGEQCALEPRNWIGARAAVEGACRSPEQIDVLRRLLGDTRGIQNVNQLDLPHLIDATVGQLLAGQLQLMPADAGGAAAAAAKATDVPEFTGQATRLTEADLQKAATLLGCELAVVKAVAKVESGGRVGFLPDKRPIILYEAHIFSKKTGHQYDDTNPTISVNKRDPSLYQGGAKEYDRLYAAMKLDRAAALESASWGMFQVMGFNYDKAGFTNVEDFVKAQTVSEANHLDAFLGFVRKNGLVDAMKKHRWANFAFGYNGPDYASNAYDDALEAAYVASGGALGVGDKGKLVRKLQQALNSKAGVTIGVDGDFGSGTETALKAYQKSKGKPESGKADAALLKELGVKVGA